MKYAKLSCTEFYPCYLQQCHSIDLFSYRTPGHGQKDHMNKVCPSFCSEVFMELALQFFSGTQHGVRGPCGVVYARKKCFTPKMGKIGQAQGSLNVQESSVFFLSSLFFLSVWSIMKVCTNVILACLFPEIWPKMLLANQISGFFNQTQDSKIDCISQRN